MNTLLIIILSERRAEWNVMKKLLKSFVSIPNMRRSDDSITSELPNVKLMNSYDILNFAKQFPLQFIHL